MSSIKTSALLSCFMMTMMNNAFAYDKTMLLNTGDPFIKRWLSTDGIKTYYLDITPSQAPGQGYRVRHTIEGGDFESDMCNATSSNQIVCLANTTYRTTLTRDDSTYSITMTSNLDGSLTYYDPDHMPKLPSVIGQYTFSAERGGVKTNYSLVMTSESDPTAATVASHLDDANGYTCNYQETYHFTQNSDGTQTYFSKYNEYVFKYDPTNQTIYKANQNSMGFYPAACASFINDSDNTVVFHKSK